MLLTFLSTLYTKYFKIMLKINHIFSQISIKLFFELLYLTFYMSYIKTILKFSLYHILSQSSFISELSCLAFYRLCLLESIIIYLIISIFCYQIFHIGNICWVFENQACLGLYGLLLFLCCILWRAVFQMAWAYSCHAPKLNAHPKQ